MLGYKHIPEKYITDKPRAVKVVNELIRPYERCWHPFYDACIFVGVEDKTIVYTWREQAEVVQRRSKGLGAMSREEI